MSHEPKFINLSANQGGAYAVISAICHLYFNISTFHEKYAYARFFLNLMGKSITIYYLRNN